MSREIDLSDLSRLKKDELIYAHQRTMITDAQLRDQGVEPVSYADIEVPLEDRANTGNANTEGISKEEYDRRVKAREGAVDGESDDDEPEYSSMSNDALRAELARRDLEVSGNKAELIARLEADDEADEDSEED